VDAWTADGGTITVVKLYDQTGNGHDLYEINGSGPMYSPAGINGLPSGRFDGRTQYWAVPEAIVSLIGAGQSVGVFGVIHRDDRDDRGTVIAWGNDGSSTPFCQVRATNRTGSGEVANQLKVQVRDDAGQLKCPAGGIVGDGVNMIGAVIHRSKATAWVNGLPVVLGADIEVGPTTLTNCRVGVMKLGSAHADFFRGELSELMIFGQLPDPARVNQIGGALQNIRGFPWGGR
ncbi:MAG: hypothetical protein AB7S36_23185, partial [Planctomycetota bacterium]